ncbi:MAG TPA: hypothetical protein DDZ51_10495 [Planctomycetaceae bacterium]|nr:hypothetical protein [Planctomycetaceae bacterium]
MGAPLTQMALELYSPRRQSAYRNRCREAENHQARPSIAPEVKIIRNKYSSQGYNQKNLVQANHMASNYKQAKNPNSEYSIVPRGFRGCGRRPFFNSQEANACYFFYKKKRINTFREDFAPLLLPVGSNIKSLIASVLQSAN